MELVFGDAGAGGLVNAGSGLPVIAIFGPTASGKSVVAEAVAARVDGDVVSADAMQVYRGLPILTNQSPARLVGIWPLDHVASVAEYAELARQEIDGILAAGRTPVVVGGTGLYLRAALVELKLPPAPSEDARERWQRTYDELGAERAHALLAERDARAAAAIHPNDRRRVIRALELSELGHSLHPEESRLWAGELRHPTVVFGLDVPHEELDRRIEERTRSMFERGVDEEVRRAFSSPLSVTARKVMGLSEVAELPREQAIETITLRTRRYAAYQRKWMRRIPGLVSVRANRSPEEVADEIVEVARTGQRLSAARTD